ncbi:hypothetical protein [Burkholderia contaminans]|nr:hypothetical protein [Burkholderia contaminans]
MPRRDEAPHAGNGAATFNVPGIQRKRCELEWQHAQGKCHMSTLVMRELVIVAFILYLGAAVLVALRSGVANAGGRRVARRSNPWLFSLIVGVQTGFFALFCWAGLFAK